MASQSVYRGLSSESQEIRLLVVEPGVGSDIIRCHFDYCQLESESTTHEYETISYVWGDPTVRGSIRLSNEEISVPASSEKALRRMRYPDRQRVLWIDAVCINQEDYDERSNQVAFMDQIYSQGTRNLIWLGEGNETTPTALRCFHKLVDEMKTETDNFDSARDLMLGEDQRALGSDNGLGFALTPDEQHSICEYYASPWFRRLWVIQEVALAQSNICYCGDTECDFDLVLKAAQWLQYKWRWLPNIFSSEGGSLPNAVKIAQFCDPHLGYFMIASSALGLLNLLSSTGGFNTSDNRDHIFGLLGLARKFSRDPPLAVTLLPDYTKSVSATFIDAAKYCIAERDDLEFLNIVKHRSGLLVDGLPTWVPNWHQKNDQDEDAIQFAPLFGASSSEGFSEFVKTSLVEDHLERNRLRTEGFCVAEIERCSAIFDSNLMVNVLRAEQSQLERLLFGEEYGESDRIGMDSSTWPMTLTAGVDVQMQRWAGSECVKAAAALDSEVHQYSDPALMDFETELKDKQAASYARSSFVALYNRCIFTTRDGRIGLGPKIMMSGDVVAVIVGFSMPVVLRRIRANANEFNFVGACYMYGIMDGELVDERCSAGEDFEEFILV